MAAHIGQPTRSRRFIKMYLATWGLLASGALVYLAVLTLPSETAAPPPRASVEPAKSQPPEVTVRQVKTAEVKSLAEVQGSLSEIRKDVSQLQEAVGERVENEKVVQTRLTALEERVPPADPNQPPAAAPGTGTTVGERPPLAAGEPPFRPMPEPEAGARTRSPVRPIETGSILQAMVSKPPVEAPKAETPKAEAPKVETAKAEVPKVEAPKVEIVFGEPVVTRAGAPELAVQLATGSSPQVLKQSWGHLSEQHAALSTLQPRVVAPRGKGRNYRLIAGPVATEADAARICSELGAGPQSCFVTPYAGAPL